MSAPDHDHDLTLDSAVTLGFTHRVRFTKGVFVAANPALQQALTSDGDVCARRAIVIVDEGVAQTHVGFDGMIRGYFAAHALTMPTLMDVVIVSGGEACKQDTRLTDHVINLVDRHRICRKSFVIAVGGGAMLDAVGYGAATAHRGVRLVRVPSTVLAQDDAAMGVKNGINRFGKKNFVGAFAVPYAVLCDESLLTTLCDSVFRAGFSEAVKIALLKDPTLFEFIEHHAQAIAAREPAVSNEVIRRSAALHLNHIVQGGDPFECHEARPLDFGHWAAHRLESLSGYAISHGDAVALGLLLDCRYSNLCGWLSDADFARVQSCLERLRLPMHHALLANSDALLQGLDEFREHLGGTLTITMLKSIGHGFEVHAVDANVMRQAAAELG
jgi:3-dehydroquinate synthase